MLVRQVSGDGVRPALTVVGEAGGELTRSRWVWPPAVAGARGVLFSHRLVELAQYNAAAFTDVCLQHGIRRSMGRVGSSYDNAFAESFFQGLKRELLHGRRWTSKAQTRLKLFRWLSYYNRRRRHSALGYCTSAEANNNASQHVRCRSLHETPCPFPGISPQRTSR